jgi:hypothetical protein
MSKQMLSKWFEDFKNQGVTSDWGHLLIDVSGADQDTKNAHQAVLNDVFDFSKSGLEDREIALEDLEINIGIIYKMILKYYDALVESGLEDEDELNDYFINYFCFDDYVFNLFGLENSDNWQQDDNDEFRMFPENEIEEMCNAWHIKPLDPDTIYCEQGEGYVQFNNEVWLTYKKDSEGNKVYLETIIKKYDGHKVHREIIKHVN